MSTSAKPLSSAMRVFPLRLHPNTDVFTGIRSLMTRAHLRSVFILGCVGSVKTCQLRMASSTDVIDLQRPHEIVSLNGTFDRDACHVHGSFSDEKGHVVGGHVMRGQPMTVFTTVELLLGECEDVVFGREMDPQSGYPELVIHTKDIEDQ